MRHGHRSVRREERCALTFGVRFDATTGQKKKDTSALKCATEKDNGQMHMFTNKGTRKQHKTDGSHKKQLPSERGAMAPSVDNSITPAVFGNLQKR